MRPLAVLGNVNVDLILGPAAPWPAVGTEIFVDHDELRVGGSAGNTALAWQAMGVPFTLCASAGEDAFGDILQAAFTGERMRLMRAPARTTITVAITHPDGERTFFTTRGHLPLFSVGDALDALATAPLSGGWLLLSGAFQTERLMEGYDRVIDAARAAGARIAVDPGWPPEGWTAGIRAFTQALLARSDLALFNEVEAQHLTGCDDAEHAARALFSLMPADATAVVKCGPGGALACTRAGGSLIAAKAPPVTVIDTIGAGDTFNAGVLAALAADETIEASLHDAVTLASRAISTSPRRYV